MMPKNQFLTQFLLLLFTTYFILPFGVFAQKPITGKLSFENFVKKFPVAILPFKIDRKIIDKSFTGLKLLTPNEIETFLLQKASDTNTIAFYPMREKDIMEKSQKTEVQLLAEKKVFFFVVNKLNLQDNITSLVVYRFDKSVQKNYGLVSYGFFMFNFDQKGVLINTISLAKEEYFMTARFWEGFLEKNDKNEVILKIAETDYYDFDKKKHKKSNYIANTYYLITPKMTIENVNERYYPYLGKFLWQDDEMIVDQNEERFMVMRGKKGSGGWASQELITHDLQKGIFTIKTEDMGVVQGEFNAEKTEIKLTKTDNTTFIYKKTGKW